MISPQDQKLVKAFVANKPLFEAIRRVLLQGMIGEDFAAKNWVFTIDKGMSDTALGKRVKVTTEALRWIESAFNDLNRIGASNPQASNVNEAR